MKARYLFYLCRGIGSVFDSQVISLITAIDKKKVFKNVYLLLGIADQKEKEKFQKKNLTSDIKVIFYKSYPNYPFFNILQRKSISKVLSITNIDLDEVIFHIRGEITAWHLSKVLGKKYNQDIIPDIRGTSKEEVAEFFDISKVKKIFKIWNYNKALCHLNKFKRISVVSEALKEYLIEKYKIQKQNIFITPNLAGFGFQLDLSRRIQIRSKLGINKDDVLIIFSSGGAANWQSNNILENLAQQGFKVLNLSSVELHHRNIINKFVDYSEVPSYLNAADVAVIWREKSVVNKVASPVKFSEYVSCGLPVIANTSVDMIAEYIATNDAGIIINNLSSLDINALRELKQKDRISISKAGLMMFGIDTITNSYLNIYSKQ